MSKLKEMDRLPKFSGPFKDLIPQYIEYKRAQGNKIYPPFVYHLRRMDNFFKDMGVSKPEITREMYDQWTKIIPPEKESNTQKRQSTIRGFAKYLVSIGYDNIYTGYDDTRIFKRDFIPYVFSHEEIGRMFSVLSSRCGDNPCYDNDAFRIAMLLYYCCGLRKSEAQSLTIKDVDFDTGKITVLHGKNDVSRIIVVAHSLLIILQKYRDKYLSNADPDENLFHGPRSKRYTESMLYQKFHNLLDEAGIPRRADGGRQRLHDMRHTFCVRALEQMQEKGFDLYTSLPLLSVYLGHKHITETEYYLRMLDEHFGSILAKTASYSPDIFPKYEEEGGAQNERTE
ncbi:MAG: tyrosine-type recombinase/integrase [Lachnospiraceae bacterium]|nr:tyrosine-type recombinase/integrase [Lachnospiraceae bacterium]